MDAHKIILNKKTAEIWIARKANCSCLVPQILTLSKQGYIVVIYRSGQIPLEETTAQLLQANS